MSAGDINIYEIEMLIGIKYLCVMYVSELKVSSNFRRQYLPSTFWFHKVYEVI